MGSIDKKKQREKESKKKVLARREVIRAQAKESRTEENESRRIKRINNRLEGRTIVNRSEEKLLDQLSHNLEILEALKREQNMMKEAQENTPLINMEGVPQIPPPQQQGSFGASADVVFTPNPEPKKEEDEEAS